MVQACFFLPELICSTLTFSAASGGTLVRSVAVIVAFCARLEKLLLRDDMYLYSPGLNFISPRSMVAASFSQFCHAESEFASSKQRVCLASAACIVSLSSSRAPPNSLELSGFHSQSTSNMPPCA